MSRPRREVFREAAKLAYNFKWPKSEIMPMTRNERNEWMAEIDRIVGEEESKRNKGMSNEIKEVLAAKAHFDSRQEKAGW